MSADQPKPRFEPPPWEQDAFEQFQKERDAVRAREELNAALRAVKEEAARNSESAEVRVEDSATGVGQSPTGAGVAEADTEVAPAVEVMPQARIDAMLIQLRGEEPTAKATNMGLVNSVMGFMSLTGVVIIIEAALWFAKAQSSNASTTMLAATLSFMVFLTGLGFIGGAVMLFRKYHR
jgi:hypothetical protein